MRRPRLALLAAAAWGVALAGLGCAPPPPGLELAGGAARERYLVALEQRSARATALDAEVSLWLRRASGARLPGVLGDLRLGAPDRFRLRVRDPLGGALELGGSDTRFVAVLPSREAYFESGGLGDSLGLARAGELVVRIAAALWRPPDEAWADSPPGNPTRSLQWVADRERVSLRTDAAGLPVAVELVAGAMPPLRIEYRDWLDRGGTRWPGRIEIEDSAATTHLTCRLERVRSRGADPARLAVAIPSDAKRLEWTSILHALARLEGR